MAYPDAILTTGILDTYSDIFEYFKGATEAYLLGDYQAEYSAGWWLVGFLQDFTSGANYPITRGQFNTMVNNNFPDSADLLSENEPASGWPTDKVNDWAKIKCFQLAIFGSVSGSTSQSSLSYVTGTRDSTSTWRQFDQAFLRLALARFDTYGTCYPEEATAPPPTNLVTDTGDRTFNWTNASGYPNLNDYEYFINDGVWHVVAEKPITIPTNTGVEIGGFAVRTREDDYYSSSDEIYNTVAITKLGIVVTVEIYCTFSGGQIIASVNGFINQQLSTNITVSGNATYYLEAGGNYTFSYSLVFPTGSTSVGYNEPVGGPQGPVGFTQINTGVSVPSTVDSQPVVVEW